MELSAPEAIENQISLRPVGQDNWRDVARLEVYDAQREFVSEPSSYLALCAYGEDWRPLAIVLQEKVIGFLMWSTDPADGSCWLGGLIIDKRMQRQGYGEAAVTAAISQLGQEHGYRDFALSYLPNNAAARSLYRKLGFAETDEWEGAEIVVRLSLPE
jgi:diamine N-acetyltransferase